MAGFSQSPWVSACPEVPVSVVESTQRVRREGPRAGLFRIDAKRGNKHDF